ncbi:MAG: Tol-Pal system beta propeller repeat protein TolB, partial [Hyphomicrobiales bacterium]
MIFPGARITARTFLLFLTVIAAALTGAPQRAHAVLEIDINRGVADPMPIALPVFVGDSQYGADVVQVIANNLNRSGLFRTLPQESFLEQITNFGKPPRFGDWRIIRAQALVTGRVTVQADGRLKAEFRLWDIFGEQQMIGLSYVTSAENWRRIGHLISDAVYQRLTGERGYFDTRIVYIEESGPKTKRVKRLSIMDQDGFNKRSLTNGRSLVLTPRFSPTSQEITYMSYATGRPRVYLYNIETGQRETVGDFPGMTFAPRFSPDGKQVIMSLQRGGNSDIYTMDLRTRQTRQITNTAAIDTAPSYSPDGLQIVFESDREGSQQIYVMNADGSNQRRISFGPGRYSTPVWWERGENVFLFKNN